MPEAIGAPKSLDIEHKGPDLVVTSSTFYRDWYPGDLLSSKDADKVRGDLTLSTLDRVIQRGFKVIDIDGGSTQDFLTALQTIGATVVPQKESGISAGKREAIIEAMRFDPKAIFLSEPEKPSIMAATESLLRPIAEEGADIVFAKRDKSSFDSYPPVQAHFEQRSNDVANALLKSRGLLPNTPDADLDWWMGMRMIKNSPEVTELFLTKYDINPFGTGLDNVINLEAWSNALYLPVVRALSQGLQVVSVPVHYEHPEVMTQSEVGSTQFDRKRELQFRGIITAMIEMVRKIEEEKGSSKASRLRKI